MSLLTVVYLHSSLPQEGGLGTQTPEDDGGAAEDAEDAEDADIQRLSHVGRVGRLLKKVGVVDHGVLQLIGGDARRMLSVEGKNVGVADVLTAFDDEFLGFALDTLSLASCMNDEMLPECTHTNTA